MKCLASMPSDRFIRFAEECRLISAIGEGVVQVMISVLVIYR